MLQGNSFWELIERRAAESPDQRLLVDEAGRELTFGQYRDRAERVAAGFHDLGVGAGTVVSWLLPTWLEAFVLAGALCRLGATQNPILTILGEREVAFIVRQAGSRYLVVPSEFRGTDFAALAGRVTDGTDTEVLVTDRDLPEADPSGLPEPPAATPADDAPVRWLFYTSGTTSDPKGAQHTDHTIMATARGMCERLELTPDDRNALAFPFTHIAGPIWLASSLQSGCSQIITATFDPEATPELLRREDVTLAGSGTFFHRSYLAAQRQQPDEPIFPNVRAFPGGGAPKPPQLHYQLKEELGGAGILSGYGLTEAPILTMSGAHDDDDALANTEGSAMPGVELKIVTVDGKVAGVGEEGEIRAKAPQMMRGYVDSSLDAEAFDEEGYFRTGDLGRLDEDGNVAITGRLKDIIIRKGENVSAKEVEDILYGHPAVADVAVIGIPDEEVGERVCAVVVPADGGDAPSMEDVQSFLEEQGLSKRKWPERLEIIDAMPRNPAGKVLKKDLRGRFSPT